MFRRGEHPAELTCVGRVGKADIDIDCQALEVDGPQQSAQELRRGRHGAGDPR